MSEYLYIFPHIQKTAGSTIRYHIRKNLKEDEWLLFNRKSLKIGEDSASIDFKDILKAAKKYIGSIGKERKQKVKVIFGPWVPYGVHKFFPNRKAMYFTFVREPLSRTVSLYNHRRQIVEEEKQDKMILLNAKKYLLVDGKIPDFMAWLKNNYNLKDTSTSMYKYLKSMGYIKKSKNLENSIKYALDKFYFIGILECFSEDSLYIFRKMDFKGYFLNQNVSKKYFKLGNNKEKLRDIVRKKIKKTFYYTKKL